MKFILSPARNMRMYEIGIPVTGTKPAFESETLILSEKLREYSPWDLESYLKVSEKIAYTAFTDIQEFSFDKRGTPAVFAYDGLVYRNIDAVRLSGQALKRSESTLGIISAFYGLLRPFDLILPYRLEMQSRVNIEGNNLYKFWGDKIYNELYREDSCVINLASEEYAKVVRTHLKPGDRFIDIVFYSTVRGKRKVVTTTAKMARGKMARFILERGVKEPESLKDFEEDGFEYEPYLSGNDKYIFYCK